MSWPFRLAPALALLGVLAMSPAQAALNLCNKTGYVLYAAIAYRDGASMVTQGWTRILPGGCAAAIEQKLGAGRYYVHAHSSPAHAGAMRAWGGAFNFCVKDNDFGMRLPAADSAASRCAQHDMHPLPFAAIDTGQKHNWTTTFEENPKLGSMADAAHIGIKRLLRDNGARIAALDTRPDKSADAALAAFRARAKLPDKADDAALLSALETEALKNTAQPGYSVCNDTADAIWIALGEQQGSDWISRGWWKTPPGICAHAIGKALTGDKIYLLVHKPGGAALVSGAAKLCVAHVKFEIKGRERCKERGFGEEGFAETTTKGLSGYVAHVGPQGLQPPPNHFVMSK